MGVSAHVQDLELAGFGANSIIQTVANVVLAGIVLAVASPPPALVAFLPIPVIVWGSFLYQPPAEPRYAAVRAQVGRLYGALANNLGGIATFTAFTAEARKIPRVAAESDAHRRANADAIRLSSAFDPLIRVPILIGFTMTLPFGGRMAPEGDLEVGVLSVLVFMTRRPL